MGKGRNREIKRIKRRNLYFIAFNFSLHLNYITHKYIIVKPHHIYADISLRKELWIIFIAEHF